MQIIDLDQKNVPADCYIFKHSTRCPISSAAAAEVRSAQADLPLYWINVVEQRELSNWVAQQYGVRHESPQLLLLREGAVARVWNHGQVKAVSFSEAGANDSES